ncbi:MAG TPA: hypothetical protein PKE47_15095 [Verrucomicrobiota bacterium]|nr:hypothetical protein [Verrucomicrobiota bacterium]
MSRSARPAWTTALRRRLALFLARHTAPCADITRLASAACDRRLTWRERGRLRLHFHLCDWCRRYAEQVRWLHQLAPGLAEKAPQFQARSAPPGLRERLKTRLRQPG